MDVQNCGRLLKILAVEVQLCFRLLQFSFFSRTFAKHSGARWKAPAAPNWMQLQMELDVEKTRWLWAMLPGSCTACKRAAEEPWVALSFFSVKEGHPVTSPFALPLKFSTFRDWNNKQFTITFSSDGDLKLFVLSLLSSVVLLWWVHYSRQDSWSNPWRMGPLVILVPLHKDMWGRRSERRETMR